jgi:hypothetical protein
LILELMRDGVMSTKRFYVNVENSNCFVN